MRTWNVPVYQLNRNEVSSIETFRMINAMKGSKVAYDNMIAESHVNFIGHFATDNSSQTYVENFEDYLDHMVDIFDLKFLTFDFYPVIHDEVKYGVGSGWVIKYHYYNMMDLYARYCRDKKIPVWLVLLSVEHSAYRSNGSMYWEYPEITEGLLRMQAMNGLAFGMKGIAYWQYGANGQMSGIYLKKQALYDIVKMEKTKVWDYAKKVNDEVAKYGTYLLDATYDESRILFKDPEHKADEYETLSLPYECMTALEYTGKGILVSHLTRDDKQYIAIVNQDYENESNLTLKLKKSSNWRKPVFSETISPNVNWGDIGKDQLVQICTETLSPGGMLLIEYDK